MPFVVGKLGRKLKFCSILVLSLLCLQPLLVHDRYAKLEKGLGEIDRARAIYVHASVMADPRRDPGYWADWNAFEVHCCMYL